MLSYTKRTLQVTTNMFDLLTFLVKAPSKKGGGGLDISPFILGESFSRKMQKVWLHMNFEFKPQKNHIHPNGTRADIIFYAIN